MRLRLAALLLALASPAAAADVISRAPDRAAVTIYRDEGIDDPAARNWGGYGLAMIAETRTLDLPAGESRIVFQGVADGTLPTSAALQGLPGRIVEQNFDFEVLSPGSLIRHGLERTVHVVRTNRQTGAPITEDAVLRSGPNGTMLDFGGGRIEAFQCSGGYERLVFDELPPDLSGKAQLSTRVRVARAGRYTVRLAYLTVGLAWKASYVARVNADGTGLDLTGWLTLANHGDTTFANAPTAVVAGRLARRAVELSRPVAARRAPACWPSGNSHHPRGEQLWRMLPQERYDDELREATVATGSFMARAMPMSVPAPAPPPPPPPPQQSDLGDYKLYTLGEPTTVAARQTKQVMFLQFPTVKFERVYVVRVGPYQAVPSPNAPVPATTTLRLRNKESEGLGRALPAGHVAVRQTQDGRDLFIGEPDVRDVPVGEPFELEVGAANDVAVSWRVASTTPFVRNGRRGTLSVIEATATNARGEPVTAEVRLLTAGLRGVKVMDESAPHGTKAGDPVWRLALPANGEATVTWSYERLDY